MGLMKLLDKDVKKGTAPMAMRFGKEAGKLASHTRVSGLRDTTKLMAVASLLAAGMPLAMAQEELTTRNNSALDSSALSRVAGISTTNLAAGEGNLQSNSGAISIGDVATTANALRQRSRIDDSLVDRQDSVSIEGRAYRHSEGWMSINQAAGLGNVQSNAFEVALGISASNLSDSSLQQVMADQQGLNGTEGDDSGKSSRRIEVDETTFEGTRGVIQVNQSAGTGNATRNSFRMNMALGE
ncbi:hypothetical protein [Halomonas sp. CKK8]|uniref:hypothetical protein n=1 Tax=Halomonas sp. CKK8 TaxID=3036127 RepID=UPI00241565E5|nr:hypothetical protein [Halomonas sp. CKK8]WFM72159.1 hypothetical protein P8934_03915 [Halomonas sp. CKK8]